MTTDIAQPQVTTLRLFIVDANAIDRSRYMRWIRGKTHFRLDIEEMETGNQALKACERLPPHFMLVNDQLPDMTGLEFLKNVTHQCASSETPIIFLVGCATEEMATA
ncbi:MAG: response regulator, partial [Nitrospirota bacterium]|nr:response regulator [Nitrospirota bacterium]